MLKDYNTLITVDPDQPFTLARLTRKKKDTQRQLQYLSNRVNHIEHKQRQRCYKLSSYSSITMQERMKQKLQLKHILQSHREKQQTAHANRTHEILTKRLQSTQSRKEATSKAIEQKKQISIRMRTHSRDSQGVLITQLEKRAAEKKRLWQIMHRAHHMSIFKRKMKDNLRKIKANEERRVQAERLERQSQRLEQNMEQLYGTLNKEQERSVELKKLYSTMCNDI